VEILSGFPRAVGEGKTWVWFSRLSTARHLHGRFRLKMFPEQRRMEIRVDASGNQINSKLQATATRPPRILQLAATLYF
jgi:hypothetical protein